MLYAARDGHVVILEWAHANGCPMPNVSHKAIKHNHLDVLKWAASADGFPMDETMYAIAAKRGHLTILKRLKAKGCPMPEGLSLDVISEHPTIRKWFFKEYAKQGLP